MRPGVRAPAIAAAVCAAALVALLVAAYAVPPFPSLDATALGGLESLTAHLSATGLNAVAHTADPLPLALMLAVVVAAGFAAGRRRQAVAAALAVGGANLVAQILKVVLAHPRFQNQVAAAAFPSGHATASMSIALAAVIVATPRWRMLVAPLAGCYALAVATSILILGWHFPSDALGGILVASSFAFASVAAMRALSGRVSELTPLRSLAIPPPHPLLWVTGLAAASLVALAKAPELLSFARSHTTATAALGGVAAACAAMLASASLFADR